MTLLQRRSLADAASYASVNPAGLTVGDGLATNVATN